MGILPTVRGPPIDCPMAVCGLSMCRTRTVRELSFTWFSDGCSSNTLPMAVCSLSAGCPWSSLSIACPCRSIETPSRGLSARAFRYLFMDCPRAVRRLPRRCLWAVREQSAALYISCSWAVHILPTGCRSAVRGLFACCPWTVRGYFFPYDAHDDWLIKQTVRQLSAGCPQGVSSRAVLDSSRAIRGLSLDCPWTVGCPWACHTVSCPSGPSNRLSVGCPWAVQGLPADRGLSVVCSRAGYGLSAGHPWAAGEMSVGCPRTVRKLHMECPRAVRQLSMGCLWVVHALFVGCFSHGLPIGDS